MPKPREIWQVKDLEVRLHSESRVDKGRRPVLVLYSKAIEHADRALVNVLPLSASAQADRFIFPIARGYCQTFAGFVPDKNSMALVNFYQPIESKYFEKKCGLIDEGCYNAIVNILCCDLIGYESMYQLSTTE